MKKLLLIFMLAGLLACNKEDNDDDAGNYSNDAWVLVEEYYDPGDGSGDFEPTNKSLSITWNDDNSFSASGNLCSLSLDNETTTEGTFNVDTEEMYVTNCEGAPENTYTLTYELNETELLVYFPCIEGCALKFAKVLAL